MRQLTRSLIRLVDLAQRLAFGTLQAWLILSTVYLLALLSAARRSRSREPARHRASLHVVVLVPAQNEETGIAETVGALRRQDYTDELLEVLVIADNCSDATAERARAAGALVWERDAADDPGKGQALNWAIHRLWTERPRTEVVAIVDADCEASPNLVRAMADAIANGAQAVQADYRVANPAAAPVASLRSAGFRLKHVIRARGRQRLGLSCNLFGTGMAFSTLLLREIRWPGSVTEDTEFFLRIIAAGFRVVYVDDGFVTSRMPETAEEADQQQLRWETGNAELARRQLIRMVGSGVVRRDIQRLGAAAELAAPSQTLLAVGNLALFARSLLIRGRWTLALPVVTALGQTAYVLGGLAAAGGAQTPLRAAPHLPRFLASRSKVLVRVSMGKGASQWVRTPRRP